MNTESEMGILMEQILKFLRQVEGAAAMKVRCAHCGECFYKGEGYSWDRGHYGKVYHAECLKDKRVLEITSRLEERSVVKLRQERV